jgi:hypothetical protein
MKLSFASLFAIVLISAVLLVGCGDSETVSRPDTTPPLAPVVLGALGNDNAVGLWWQRNTEPDLAGYLVYKVERGVTTCVTRTPILDTYYAVTPNGYATVQLYVTALDWVGNESSPSQVQTANLSRSGGDREIIEGHESKEPNDF